MEDIFIEVCIEQKVSKNAATFLFETTVALKLSLCFRQTD